METATTDRIAEHADQEQDANRIPHVLARLERFWMQNQQYSLGQIVSYLEDAKGMNILDLGDREIAQWLEEKVPGWA